MLPRSQPAPERGAAIWCDGRLLPAGAAVVDAADSAFAEGIGCFTSVRIAAGAPRFLARHLRRLERDARALGLPAPDPRSLERGLRELAEASFPDGEGVLRLQLSRGGDGRTRALAAARALGADPRVWRAITAPRPHPGPGAGAGLKLSGRLAWALAGAAARAAGADEALLFDRAGRLVEGSRSNVLVIDAAGRPIAPPPERGAVAGIALEIVRERLPGLRHGDFSHRALLASRGALALNAVRGARALDRLDGRPLGPEGGAWAERLDALLDGAA